jgi:hypothetical protein
VQVERHHPSVVFESGADHRSVWVKECLPR